MAKTAAVGDPSYYQGKAGTIVELRSVLGENGREPVVVMKYRLPANEAAARPKVTLAIDPDTGKPTGEKVMEAWPEDVPRYAKTAALATDLRWDTGRSAWIVNGHGLKTEDGSYYPDASHPENLKLEREG